MKNPVLSNLIKKTLLWSAAVILCLSCIDDKSDQLEKAETVKILLDKKSLFNLRLIKRVRRSATPAEKLRSKKLFRQAFALNDKKNNSTETLQHLEKSIITYPRAATFFILGTVYMELDSISEAIQSFQIAEKLNYKPLSDLYYQLSSAYSIQNNSEAANKYLKVALEKGYNDINTLVKDPHFQNIKRTEEYREILADNIQDEADRRKALFDVFISKFPKIELPYAIDYSKTTEFNYQTFIPSDFEELLYTSDDYSETWEHAFVGRLDSTDKYTSVIYAEIKSSLEGVQPIVENYLVVYDDKGNIIDKILIACSCSRETTLAGKINKTGDINVTEFKNIWKADPNKGLQTENSLDTVLVRTNYFFKLQRDGKIKIVERRDENGIVARI